MEAKRGSSIVFLFILAVLVAGSAYFFATRAVNGEVANRASVVQLCVTGNEFRAEQVKLWNYVARLSAPPPHETAAQMRQRETAIRALVAYVQHVFAPRDCSK